MNFSISPLIACAALAIAGAAQADDYTVPKTSFGAPDLQGTWTSATATFLERPNDVEKLVLNEEEAREFEMRLAGFLAANDELPEGELQAGQDVGGYNSFWLDPGTRAMRVNGEIRSSIIVSPADGKLPYRLGARAKLFAFFTRVGSAFDDPELRPLGERCIVGFGSTSGPPMLPVVYNNNYQIAQAPGYVTILVEMNHDARVIRIGGEHLPDNIRPWMGDSIGHWDGDTLVVETTNFHPGQSFRAGIKQQLYLTKDAIVTERFTRIAANEIVYAFTVDDPGSFTQTWSGEVGLRPSDGQIYEYACHEGNYAMPGILAGARREEAEAAAGGEE